LGGFCGWIGSQKEGRQDAKTETTHRPQGEPPFPPSRYIAKTVSVSGQVQTMTQSPSIQDIVVETLAQMGIRDPSPLVRTLALQGGCLVAEKFRYEEGYAVCPVGGNVIEFYDDHGKLLKVVNAAIARRKETAA
jgi:hypothetical protein